MTQLITQPTRITSTSSTLLDVILTNKSDSVIHSDTTPCPVGDHELISVTIDLHKPKRQPTVITFRQLKHYSPETFCNISFSQKEEIFKIDNVNVQVKLFTDHFMKYLGICAPVTTKVMKRPPAPWIAEDL